MSSIKDNGLHQIRSHFDGLEDCYAIIGGMACQLLLSHHNLQFRSTRDVDIVLIVNAKFNKMVKAVWTLVKDGRYKSGWKNSNKPHFYRFTEPQVHGYPTMIELFSTNQTDISLIKDQTIIPVYSKDCLSSLSAILLDKDYYDFMKNGKCKIDGITILDQYRLVPLKAKAHLNLLEAKIQGVHVNKKDLTKHKKDVYRLLQTFELNIKIKVPQSIKCDLCEFVELVKNDTIPLEQMNIMMSKKTALDLIKNTYVVR